MKKTRTVTLTIDNQKISTSPGLTILQAAGANQIDIPSGGNRWKLTEKIGTELRIIAPWIPRSACPIRTIYSIEFNKVQSAKGQGITKVFQGFPALFNRMRWYAIMSKKIPGMCTIQANMSSFFD